MLVRSCSGFVGELFGLIVTLADKQGTAETGGNFFCVMFGISSSVKHNIDMVLHGFDEIVIRCKRTLIFG
jgi:hypothetical protein